MEEVSSEKPKRKKSKYRKAAKNEGMSVFLRHVRCGKCKATFFTERAKNQHRRISHSDYWQESFRTIGG